MKEIIVAQNAGFCFGVKRAVDMALNVHLDEDREEEGHPESSQGERPKVYRTKGRVRTLGPLIHNNDAIQRLEENDVFQIGVEGLASLTAEDAVVIRSHGVTPDIMERIAQQGCIKLDATCPFVKTIHSKVKKYHSLGYQIVIVGDYEHPEVVGIHGWCDNSAIITRDPRDLHERNLPDKICVVAQTTERQAVFDSIVKAVSDSQREVITFNTICNATKVRQSSTADVAQQVDAMVVIGGRNSSNTKKLFEISSVHCPRTVFVENSQELPAWLWSDGSIQRIGVTAGASTPDWVIQDVVAVLQNDSEQSEE